MQHFEETCPSCNNTKDNYFMGSGENFTLYYSCYYCGHSFVVDGSIYVKDEDAQNEKAIRDTGLLASGELH